MLQKTVPFLLAALLLASCSVSRDRMTAVSFADYTAYPDMWISPNDCPMQHAAIGQLSIQIAPAIVPARRGGDGIYSAQHTSGPSFERIPYDELLAMAVAEARARGANGISNLTITDNSKPGEDYATMYYVSGLLVRIE